MEICPIDCLTMAVVTEQCLNKNLRYRQHSLANSEGSEIEASCIVIAIPKLK